MERVTDQEYRDALAVIRRYEEQVKQDKLKPYEGCTINDILTNEFTLYNNKATAHWVTKDKTIPDRNPDGVIIHDDGFYHIQHGSTAYESFEDAEKALISSFKRKKYING